MSQKSLNPTAYFRRHQIVVRRAETAEDIRRECAITNESFAECKRRLNPPPPEPELQRLFLDEQGNEHWIAIPLVVEYVKELPAAKSPAPEEAMLDGQSCDFSDGPT